MAAAIVGAFWCIGDGDGRRPAGRRAPGGWRQSICGVEPDRRSPPPHTSQLTLPPKMMSDDERRMIAKAAVAGRTTFHRHSQTITLTHNP